MDVAPTPVIDMSEHRSVLRAAIAEVAPARVAAAGLDATSFALLGEWAAEIGYRLGGDPDGCDVLVCAAGDYATVKRLLAACARRGAAALVGGTGWPCGRRDAHADLAGLPATERARFAARLPMPGEPLLSTVASPVAFALYEGGPGNGVRTAIEDVVGDDPDVWEVRLLIGFGGLAVLLPRALASEGAWGRILPEEQRERGLARLEFANLGLRFDHDRLRAELVGVVDRLEAALGAVGGPTAEPTDEPTTDLDVGSADALTRRLQDVEERLARRSARHAERADALAAAQARAAELSDHLRDASRLQAAQEEAMTAVAGQLGESVRRLEERDAELATLRERHRDELIYIGRQAAAIAASGTWRWGHRIALARSRVLLRRTRGTDAVTRLVERVSVDADRR